jgi:glycosyltransferase involved in cell wall biosynthesis
VIVLLHGGDTYGAVEHYVAAVVRGARGVTAEEVVLVHADVPELAPFGELEGGNIHVERLPAHALAEPAPVLALRLARLLRRHRPRLVHVVEVWPAASIAARLAGVRHLLLTHHTPELPRRENAFGRTWSRLGWAMRPEVIYTSEADRRFDGRRLHSHVVPLGIDLERFAQASPAARGEGPRIGTVGRLSAQKGHRVLIDAAPIVLKRFPDAHFLIVGEGELRGELQRRIEEQGLTGRIELTGARSDIPALLASLDVFVMPSLFEGLCVAVLEAQAAGVPVVATGVGGMVETVVPGVTGIRCEQGDPVSLAAGITLLLEDRDLARSLAAEAGSRVRARFSEQQMVEGTLELYGL